MHVNPAFVEQIPEQHCHHPVEPYMPILKRVTAVALIAFAAHAQMQLFVPFFIGGVAVGIFQHYFLENQCVRSDRIASCAHGFLEQTTGVQLPELISVICGAYLAYHHIDHHPESDVPVAAIIAGAWVVQLFADAVLKKPHHAHVS